VTLQLMSEESVSRHVRANGGHLNTFVYKL